MIYVLFNHDGSVKRKNITEILQKGNAYVNKLFVSIDGYEPSAYTFVAYCLLPDGTTTTMVSESATQVINGVSYNGVNITITKNETVYAGIIKINLRAVQNDKVLVTYTLALAINESVIESSDPIFMSVEQYENLLDIVLFKSSVLSTFTYTDNITSTVYNAQLDGQGFINFSLGDTTKVVLSADEALYRFSLKQDNLIAGQHIVINDNVIDVVNVEGLIEKVDLTDSNYEITQEEVDLLDMDNLNYIILDGKRYNYSSANEYIYIDTTSIEKITIDTSELSWALTTYSLNQLEKQEIDIRTDLDLGITTAVPQSTSARIIATDNQLVIAIRVVGTGYSAPTGTILSDYELPSAIASKIKSLYNSRHIAYGTCITQFGTDRYLDTCELAWASAITTTEVDLVITSSHEASIEAKNITFDLRIVLDF